MKVEKALLLQELNLMKSCSSAPVNEDVSDKVIFFPDCMMNVSRGRLVTIDAVISFDFTAMFLIDNLLNIVKAMPNDEINLVFNQEKDELKISSGSTKMGLKAEPMIDLEEKKNSIMETISEQKFNKLPDNFIDGLEQVLPCACIDKSHPLLYNLHVDKQEIIASDNFKIGHFLLNSEIPKSFLIDPYNIKAIIDFNPKKYAMLDDKIILKRNNNYQVCAINDEKFPAFTEIVNRDATYTLNLPEEIKESIYLSKQIPGKDPDRQIELSIESNILKYSCKTQTGWVEKKFKIQNKDKFNFRMNLNVLDELTSGLGLTIEINDQGTGKIKNNSFSFVFPVEIFE
jgi:hypothetical protein